MKYKICGMSHPDNIVEVANLKPDYMGFIFYEPSPRHVRVLTKALPENIQKIGVFVDASKTYIVDKIHTHKLNLLQLHGNESPSFCRQLGKHLPIIKSFSIGEDFNFEELKPYQDACDYYLFDTKGQYFGGNGRHFDWKLLANYLYDKPFFLSGGIGLEDIGRISSLLTTYRLPLYAIDINSCFEDAPGYKNIDKLKRFQVALSQL